MTQQELAALLRAYHAAKIAADKVKALGDAIKAEANARGVEKLEGGVFIATLSTVTTTTLDGKKLKSEMPETWARFSRTSTTTRLNFK